MCFDKFPEVYPSPVAIEKSLLRFFMGTHELRCILQLRLCWLASIQKSHAFSCFISQVQRVRLGKILVHHIPCSHSWDMAKTIFLHSLPCMISLEIVTACGLSIEWEPTEMLYVCIDTFSEWHLQAVYVQLHTIWTVVPLDMHTPAHTLDYSV